MKGFILLILISQISISASFTITNTPPKGFKKAIKKHRKQYKKDFLENNGPVKKQDLKYLDFFAPVADYRVKVKFERTPDEKPFDIPTSSTVKKKYVKYGELSFQLNGNKHQLNVYQSLKLRKMPQYRDYLFLPFKDPTNGKETYGGGRYLDLKIGDLKTGSAIVDFNKAYNPYCAFADGFSCPIPPKENHLKTPIYAGEKNFKKDTH